MFPLREPPLWMLGTGLVGYALGQWKGMPRWGFLLGLILGPLGWAIIMVWPAQAGIRMRAGAQRHWGAGAGSNQSDRKGNSRANPESSGGNPGSGGNFSNSSGGFFANPCPRCNRSVPRGKGACPHCGNVLVAVSYRVQAPKGGGPEAK